MPVMLPLFGAGLTMVFRNRQRVQQAISVSALTLVLITAVVLLFFADARGAVVLHVGGWEAPLGIALVADRLSALMIIISAACTLAVLVYSIGQGLSEERDNAPLSIYHPTYLVLVAGVSNAFLAGDLFNMYVGFEILLAASYVLLTLGGTGARIRAGTTYVVVSLLSSLIFLSAIAFMYTAVGTVNLADLAIKLDAIDPNVRILLEVMLLLAFAIKAAIFPLSSWLPDSYPTAPAPVTAVFAGLLTKVGVYAIIRMETLLFPESDISTLLMVAAGLTMLVGILGAVAQTDIKRVLSFTLVSHIGYMIFGVGLTTQVGLAGAIFYVAHHITVQTTLFLVVGLIETRAGSSKLENLGGLAKLSPLLAILFFIPAMNLAGVPPLSGFVAKLGLLQAGVNAATPISYTLFAVSLLTSLLTLYAVAKVWNRAFWQTAPPAVLRQPPVMPRVMTGATLGLVVFGLALTAFAGPIFRISDAAASALLDRAPYVNSVLGPGSAEQLRFSIDPNGQVEQR
ncbi:Na+/H+ antiporter subunit D [Micrococcales bacterium 31B]|nr:Na+/H+ antiporter subunit D [Micrococcales bacterium 31B]